MPTASQKDDLWPEAIAEVLTCRYNARVGRALAFGLPSKKHFHITYSYLADGDLHTGECFTEKPLTQGTLFPIRYDPDLPHVNRSAQTGTRRRVPLLALGVFGSVVLSLAWLMLLRGCV